MKHLGLFLFALIGLSAQAAIPEFAGAVNGSLESVHCTEIVAGQGHERATTQDVRREKGGFVTGMVIRAIWYDEQGDHHFADFNVVVANYDIPNNFIQIIGTSEKKNALELRIDVSTENSTMLINGKAQPIQRLLCEAPVAG